MKTSHVSVCIVSFTALNFKHKNSTRSYIITELKCLEFSFSAFTVTVVLVYFKSI